MKPVYSKLFSHIEIHVYISQCSHPILHLAIQYLTQYRDIKRVGGIYQKIVYEDLLVK